MSNIPNAVLLGRARHYLELALLQLKNGDTVDAQLSIKTAVANLEKVEGL